MKTSSDYLNKEIDNLFTSVINIMEISGSSQTTRFLTSTTDQERYFSSRELLELFKSMRSTGQLPDYVKDISIIGVSGNCLSERNGYYALDKKITEYEDVEKLFRSPDTLHLLNYPFLPHNISWEKEAVSIQKCIFRLSSNDIVGIIQLSIKKDYLLDIFKGENLYDNGHILLLDNDGNFIFSELQDRISSSLSGKEILSFIENNKTSSIYTVNGTQYHVIHNSLPSTNWVSIFLVPDKALMKPIGRILYAAAFSIFIAVLIAILINVFFSANITRPINQLSYLMSRAAGKDFNLDIPKSEITEISRLYQNFDTMINDTKRLMQDNINEQKAYRKLELLVLQEQINPHFLYNSLEAIIWAASNKKNEQVENLTVALSKFYRLALSKGSEMVSLNQELALTRSYLDVIQMQYSNVFQYSFNVPDNIRQNVIPKMILQPIIENSIYHGLLEKHLDSDCTGRISITAEDEKGILILTIQDNGIGMTSEQLASLQDNINTSIFKDNGGGYGLKNINQRIKLYYGDDYGMSIRSAYMQGTTIRVTLPYSKEENSAYDI